MIAVFAEMSKEEKSNISHRAQAVSQFKIMVSTVCLMQFTAFIFTGLTVYQNVLTVILIAMYDLKLMKQAGFNLY